MVKVFLSNADFSSVERTFARSRGNESVDPIVEEESIEDFVDNTLDDVEDSLEKKMKEIRSIINDKFSDDIQTEIDSTFDDIDSQIIESEDKEIPERTDLEYSVFGFSATPNRDSSNEVRNISINFIGKPYGIDGIALGFMNMTYGDVNWAQIAILSNVTGGDHYGYLGSSIYNHNDGDLWGAATSGIFNTSNGSIYGVQAAGIFNTSKKELYGIQASGIFNHTNNITNGAQGIRYFQCANGHMNGLQATGIFNIANGQLNGGQLSGIFNVADNINGVQISLVNVGKQVNGMQIGLININDDINGLPIGLITISKSGIMDFGAWYESSGFVYTGLQTGSKNFYNFFYLGLPVENYGSVLVSGLGIGARINLGGLYIDLDASVKNVAPGTDYMDAIRQTFSADQMFSLYPNFRVSAGLKMFGFMSIVGGLSLDVHIPNVTNRSLLFHNSVEPWIIKDPQSGIDAVEIHPKWFIGIKI